MTLGVFVDTYATLKRVSNTNVTTILGRHLPIQIDTINAEILLDGGGEIPTDHYAIYSFGWQYPLPQRGDYFVDEANGTTYQVFGVVKPYLWSFSADCTLYLGETP